MRLADREHITRRGHGHVLSPGQSSGSNAHRLFFGLSCHMGLVRVSACLLPSWFDSKIVADVLCRTAGQPCRAILVLLCQPPMFIPVSVVSCSSLHIAVTQVLSGHPALQGSIFVLLSTDTNSQLAQKQMNNPEPEEP